MKLGNSSRSGLSLLEILVVVAILGVLASLLFPTAKGWTDRARTAQCVSNLRALGGAAFSYASDNDGKLPSIEVPAMDAETQRAIGTSGNDRLMMALYPYASSPKVFKCTTVSSENPEPPFKNGQYNSTYNQNVYTFAARLGSLPAASGTILIYEGFPFMTITGTPPRHSVSAYSPISSISARHGPMENRVLSSNVLMADGHVKSGMYYFGWGDEKNTIPADGGIWGNDRWSFNL